MTKGEFQSKIKTGDHVILWLYSNKIVEGIVLSIEEDFVTVQNEVGGQAREIYVNIDEIEVPQKVVNYPNVKTVIGDNANDNK